MASGPAARLYTDLADYWTLVSAVDEYVEEAPLDEVAPRVGVEIVDESRHQTVTVYTLRDLRNGNLVHNVYRIVSAPRTTGAKNGFTTSGTISPMVWVLVEIRPRAMRLGT